MRFGIVGLGKMGGNLAVQAVEKGFEVVGTSRSDKPELRERGIELVRSTEELTANLPKPRIVFVYVPAGPTVDAVLDQLLTSFEPGDVIVDGGNSHFGDSARRHEVCRSKNVHFIDCGTSGGLEGARNGACFMVGGDAEAVRLVRPILEALAVPQGYVHAGPAGAGHFVKLVHNAIEFGMLQSIGEGVALLERSDYDLNLEEVFVNWSHGSVIRSWLVELMAQQLRQRPIEGVPAYVEDTGEVNWIVETALKHEVPIPAISASVMELFASRDDQNYARKAIAMMRHGFGGHPFGPDEAIRRERETGKVDPVLA